MCRGSPKPNWSSLAKGALTRPQLCAGGNAETLTLVVLKTLLGRHINVRRKPPPQTTRVAIGAQCGAKPNQCRTTVQRNDGATVLQVQVSEKQKEHGGSNPKTNFDKFITPLLSGHEG